MGMSNWSSSSASSSRLTERQELILEALRAPGEHTASDLSARLGNQVEGEDLLAIQVKVLESRGHERVRRRKDGRFVRWWVQKTEG